MTEKNLSSLTLQLESIWKHLLPTDPQRLEILNQLGMEKLNHIMSEKVKHGWDEVTINSSRQKYLVLGHDSDLDVVEKYLTSVSEQVAEVTVQYFGSCREAARSLRKLDPTGTTLLSNASWSGHNEMPIKIAGLGNHTVFLKQLGALWLAIDITARYYIDHLGQKMDVLVLSANAKDKVVEMVSEVYGDKWYEETDN